jgi:hypothetical protein
MTTPHEQVGLSAAERRVLAQIETGLRSGALAREPEKPGAPGTPSVYRIGARQCTAWFLAALGGAFCGAAAVAQVTVSTVVLLACGAVLVAAGSVLGIDAIRVPVTARCVGPIGRVRHRSAALRWRLASRSHRLHRARHRMQTRRYSMQRRVRRMLGLLRSDELD